MRQSNARFYARSPRRYLGVIWVNNKVLASLLVYHAKRPCFALACRDSSRDERIEPAVVVQPSVMDEPLSAGCCFIFMANFGEGFH